MSLTTELSNEEYHEHKAISSSAVKTVHAKSVLHWKKNKYVDSAAFQLGTAVHALLLEPEKDLVICGPETRRGKPWAEAKAEADLTGKTLLIKDDFDSCMDMVDSVRRNLPAVEMLDHPCALKEASIFNTDPDTGLALKARPDLFIPDTGLLLDVKTTRDASPKDGGFEKQFFNLGYHIQAAFYKYVLELEGYPIEEFSFLAVEKESPYAVQIHHLHKEVLEFGLLQVKDTLEQIKDVEDKDIDSTGWPSRNLILLPRWMKKIDRIEDMTDYTITNVEAMWPKINQTYKWSDADRRSVSCDAMDEGAEYTIQFKMDSDTAKALFTEMAKAYRDVREDSWPKQIEIPFTKNEDGSYEGKAKLKGRYGKEVARKPLQYDSQGNKLPDDFLLTTGSTVNIAVAFVPYNVREAGVSLRLRGVQVVKYVEMQDNNPFSKIEDGYVHDEENPFKSSGKETAEEEKAPALKVVKKKAEPKKKKIEDDDDGMDDLIENWD